MPFYRFPDESGDPFLDRSVICPVGSILRRMAGNAEFANPMGPGFRQAFARKAGMA